MSDGDKRASELDFLLQAGQEGRVTLSTVFQVLLRSEVWVLLNKDPEKAEPTDTVQPLIIEGEDGHPALVMFTDRAAAESAAERFPDYKYPQLAPAAAVIDGLSPRAGLFINPGSSHGLRIVPDGVVGFRNGLGHGFLQNIPVQETPGPAGANQETQ